MVGDEIGDVRFVVNDQNLLCLLSDMSSRIAGGGRFASEFPFVT